MLLNPLCVWTLSTVALHRKAGMGTGLSLQGTVHPDLAHSGDLVSDDASQLLSWDKQNSEKQFHNYFLFSSLLLFILRNRNTRPPQFRKWENLRAAALTLWPINIGLC